VQSIDLALILAASSAGGPSCLTSTTELAPAAGRHASVAPAKFAIAGQRGGAYAYERRYLDDDVRDAVVIDSKQSQLNRVEAVLDQAIDDGHPTISRLPRVELTYERDGAEERYSDLTLPHACSMDTSAPAPSMAPPPRRRRRIVRSATQPLRTRERCWT